MISKENFIKLKKDLGLISDEQKIKLLELTHDDFIRYYIIRSFMDENLKIKYIDTISSHDFRIIIIKSLSNDDIKIKYIDKLLEQDFENIKDLIGIIITLKNDQDKLKYISKIKEYFNKTEITTDKFMFFFDDLSSYKTEIIISLSNDEMKIKYLNEVSDIYKKRIILTLTDENKLKCLCLLKDSNEIKDILRSINNNELLRRYIKMNNLYDERSFEELKEVIIIPSFEENLLPNTLTIGIEIEGVRGNSNFIKFYNKKILGRWISKEDTSLEHNSVEVNSPVISYNINDLKELYLVCAFLKENDVLATNDCALHIHIGAKSLENKKSLVILYSIFCALEEEIFLISNEKGTPPRNNINIYSRSISSNLEKALEEEKIDFNLEESLEEFIEKIKKYVQLRYNPNQNEYVEDRRFSLNLSNANNIKKKTIEFRMSNGTLDKESIHQNIKLFGRLVYVSNEMAKLTDEKVREILSKLYVSDEEERVLNFLKFLFTNMEDINYFYERFKKNSRLSKRSMDKFNFVRLRY